MRNKEQLLESIDRFRTAFWNRTVADRCPIGIVNADVFLPVKYLRAPFAGPHLAPRDVGERLCMTDYEFAFSEPKVRIDDWLPFAAAWRAVPWLEAVCGCPVRCASGSLAAEAIAATADDLLRAPLPDACGWRRCLELETRRLAAGAADDCWISPTILRGPSDVLAAMRGLTEFCCDTLTDAGVLKTAAAGINEALIGLLDLHFSIVAPKLGGYGHIYGYWAPERTVVIQEDIMGMCSPTAYRDLFMPLNAAVVESMGNCVLFHLHSTGYRHFREVLDIPGLAGLELTVEDKGPSLRDLQPVVREILERTRLILFVDHHFEQLPDLMRAIPRDGLYVVIPDRFIGTDAAFRDFARRC